MDPRKRQGQEKTALKPIRNLGIRGRIQEVTKDVEQKRKTNIRGNKRGGDLLLTGKGSSKGHRQQTSGRVRKSPSKHHLKKATGRAGPKGGGENGGELSEPQDTRQRPPAVQFCTRGGRRKTEDILQGEARYEQKTAKFLELASSGGGMKEIREGRETPDRSWHILEETKASQDKVTRQEMTLRNPSPFLF